MTDFHFPLGASSASVWTQCPASPWISRLAWQEETEAMATGTRLHRVCAGEAPPESDYESGLMARYQAATAGAKYEVAMTGIHPLIGTKIDALRIDDDGLGIDVFDLKTGREVVKARENVQLKLGAALVLADMLAKRDAAGEKMEAHNLTFRLHIYQEGTGLPPLDTWIVNGFTVNAWIAEFKGHADAAYARGAMPVYGDHCKKCGGTAMCRLYAERTDISMPSAKLLGAAELAERAQKMRFFARYKKAIDGEAMRLAKDGRLPGATLKPGRALPYRWVSEEAVPVHFHGLRSPAQVIKDGIATESSLLDAGLISRPPSKPVIAWSDAADGEEDEF